MTIIERAAHFSTLDYVAVATLIVTWLAIGWRIEHPSAKAPSTSRLMVQYRRHWMAEMIHRDPRIFDAQIVASLRQGTAFFASTAIIALGGVLAVLGNTERLTMIASDFVVADAPAFVWEIKIVLIVLFLTNAFLKFVWANRLFAYTSILMGAVPTDPNDPLCETRSGQAAEISNLAAQSFNRGLRAVYFSLAGIAWLAGPIALLLATAFTVAVIWRREFASKSRKVLLSTAM